MVIAPLLSHVLPAGRDQRRNDPATGRSVVVPGTYARVAAHPLGPFQTLVALPKGLVDAGSVVFLVFLVGGAWPCSPRRGCRSTVGSGLRVPLWSALFALASLAVVVGLAIGLQ